MRQEVVRFFGAVLVLAGLVRAGVVCAADVSGEVRVEGGKELGHLVVYLEPTSPASAQAPVPEVRVFQHGRRFSPATTVVVQGRSVEFVNDEDREIDHNVYSLSDGNKFDVGLLARGRSKTVRFPEQGVVKYFCSVHKLMEGVLVVVPSPYYAVLDKPGKFTIPKVTTGKWWVKVYSSHRRYRDEPVAIEVGSGPLQNIQVRMRRRH